MRGFKGSERQILRTLCVVLWHQLKSVLAVLPEYSNAWKFLLCGLVEDVQMCI